jgi:hypothetical protein
MMDRKDPSKMDLEAQNGPSTPTPFLPKEKPADKDNDQFEVSFLADVEGRSH